MSYPPLNPQQFAPKGGAQCPGAGTRKGIKHSYVNMGNDTRLNPSTGEYRSREIHVCTNCGHEKDKAPLSQKAQEQRDFADSYPGPGQAHRVEPEPQPMSYQFRYRPGLKTQ